MSTDTPDPQDGTIPGSAHYVSPPQHAKAKTLGPLVEVCYAGEMAVLQPNGETAVFTVGKARIVHSNNPDPSTFRPIRKGAETKRFVRVEVNFTRKP